MTGWIVVLVLLGGLLLFLAIFGRAGKGADLFREVAALTIGSFWGAALAFAFDSFQREALRQNQRAEAGLAAIDAMDDRLCVMAGITRAIVEPARTKRYYWLDMLSYGGPLEATRINFEGLAFLLHEHPSVVVQLRNADRNFTTYVWAVKARTEFFDNLPPYKVDDSIPRKDVRGILQKEVGIPAVDNLLLASRIILGDLQVSERLQDAREELRSVLTRNLGEHFVHVPPWDREICGKQIMTKLPPTSPY